MTTRKPKPTFSPQIEWSTEQLQPVVITVEHKAPARAGETWQVETELPVAQSLLHLAKITLH